MLKMMIFVDNKFNCCYLSLASGSFDSRAASTDSRALIGDRGRDASTEVGLVSTIAMFAAMNITYFTSIFNLMRLKLLLQQSFLCNFILKVNNLVNLRYI